MNLSISFKAVAARLIPGLCEKSVRYFVAASLNVLRGLTPNTFALRISSSRLARYAEAFSARPQEPGWGKLVEWARSVQAFVAL